MPDYTWIGLGLVPIEQVNASVDIDALGVVAARLEFTTNWDSAVAFAMTKAAHPDFPWLQRSQGNIQREEANLGRVVVSYKGVAPEYAATTQKTYAIDGALSTEPIETHPNFRQFAGEPGDVHNGAVFDADGIFVGFGVVEQTDANKIKAGVRSYQVPSLILTETIVRPYTSLEGYSPAQATSMVGLGCIDTPPANPLIPVVYSSRNWLLSGVVVEDLGNGTREQRHWRLSGPRGWDTDIYLRSNVNR